MIFSSKTRIARLTLEGVIGEKNFTYDKYAPVIEKVAAWEPDHIILDINSPGGSPVQSELIANAIRNLRKGHLTRTITASIQDVGASGGYWLACAADKIIASEMSVVGSIGVVSGGFGFHAILKNHGVERRLYTAGESKASLDPFLPEKPEEKARHQELLLSIHRSFKGWVKKRRPMIDESIMNGSIFVGADALEKGLVDQFIDADQFIEENWGIKVKEKTFAPRKVGRLGKLLGLEGRISDEIATGLNIGLRAMAENRISLS